LFKIK